MKHDMISSRIREAEHAQMVAELNQKISRLEVKVSYISIYIFKCNIKHIYTRIHVLSMYKYIIYIFFCILERRNGY